MTMQEIEIQDYARQLLEAHGDKAVAEAAQKSLCPRTARPKRRGRNLEAHRGIPKADARAARKLKSPPFGRLTLSASCLSE